MRVYSCPLKYFPIRWDASASHRYIIGRQVSRFCLWLRDTDSFATRSIVDSDKRLSPLLGAFPSETTKEHVKIRLLLREREEEDKVEGQKEREDEAALDCHRNAIKNPVVSKFCSFSLFIFFLFSSYHIHARRMFSLFLSCFGINAFTRFIPCRRHSFVPVCLRANTFAGRRALFSREIFLP